MFQVTEVTALDADAVLALATVEGWPEPAEFTADTWKSYAVSAASPVTVSLVVERPEANMVHADPPLTRYWTV